MWAATISVTVLAPNYRECSLTHLYSGSNAHGGWLFIRHTHQTVAELLLPPPPLLFAVLIMRWEIPWARVFPLRSAVAECMKLCLLGLLSSYSYSKVTTKACFRPLQSWKNIFKDFQICKYLGSQLSQTSLADVANDIICKIFILNIIIRLISLQADAAAGG